MAEHRILRYPKWKPEFEAVMNSPDKPSLRRHITALEAALFTRMLELAGCTDCEDERSAMDAAIHQIRDIQRDRLGYPPVDPLDHHTKSS